MLKYVMFQTRGRDQQYANEHIVVIKAQRVGRIILKRLGELHSNVIHGNAVTLWCGQIILLFSGLVD